MKNELTDVNLMFKAIIESKSHEGGLLARFTGSSPALGSIIVRVDDGGYIGKIDAVLGNTDSPIAHIAHLDRKINPDSFLGCEAQIRPKGLKQDDESKPRMIATTKTDGIIEGITTVTAETQEEATSEIEIQT